MNSNRMEFVGNINCDGIDKVDLVKKYFDQLMGVYNIVGEFITDNINVSDADQNINMSIRFIDSDNLNRMVKVLGPSGGRFQSYGKAFIANYTVETDNIVTIGICPAM